MEWLPVALELLNLFAFLVFYPTNDIYQDDVMLFLNLEHNDQVVPGWSEYWSRFCREIEPTECVERERWIDWLLGIALVETGKSKTLRTGWQAGELVLQFKSKGSLEAESPLPKRMSVFFS